MSVSEITGCWIALHSFTLPIGLVGLTNHIGLFNASTYFLEKRKYSRGNKKTEKPRKDSQMKYSLRERIRSRTKINACIFMVI